MSKRIREDVIEEREALLRRLRRVQNRLDDIISIAIDLEEFIRSMKVWKEFADQNVHTYSILHRKARGAFESGKAFAEDGASYIENMMKEWEKVSVAYQQCIDDLREAKRIVEEDLMLAHKRDDSAEARRCIQKVLQILERVKQRIEDMKVENVTVKLAAIDKVQKLHNKLNKLMAAFSVA